VDEFEAAIRTVCEPIFEKPLNEISFGNVLLRLFQTARRFNMEVQPQLVLLQKTLLNIEGLGRQLYPELDLWKTAKPFLERTMSEQLGARSLRLRAEVRRANRRSVSAIIGTGLLLAAAMIYGLDGYAPTMVMGAPLLTWISGCLGTFILLFNWLDGDSS